MQKHWNLIFGGISWNMPLDYFWNTLYHKMLAEIRKAFETIRTLQNTLPDLQFFKSVYSYLEKKLSFLMQRYWLERILLVLPVLKVGLELASHSGQYRWEHHWPERNTTIYMNYKKLKIIKKHHNKIDMVFILWIEKICLSALTSSISFLPSSALQSSSSAIWTLRLFVYWQ